MKTEYPELPLPFKAGFKITQFFGENPTSYSPYGFKGHEGIDLVSLTSDWNIHAVEEGIVLQDVDAPRDNYGIYCVVWNPVTKRSWWYCHLQKNFTFNGQKIKKGDPIGVMGNTGNSTGAHLHLGMRNSDEDANPINTGNGYKGFVDPLKTLITLNGKATDLDTPPTTFKDYFKFDPFKELPDIVYEGLYSAEIRKELNRSFALDTLAEEYVKAKKEKNEFKKGLEVCNLNKAKLQKDFDSKLEASVKSAKEKLEKEYGDYKINLDAQFNKDLEAEKEKLRLEYANTIEPPKNDLNAKEPVVATEPDIPNNEVYSNIRKWLSRNIRYIVNFGIASIAVYLASKSPLLHGVFNSYVTPENVEVFVVTATTVIAGAIHSAMEYLRDRFAKVNGVKNYDHLLYKFPFGLL